MKSLPQVIRLVGGDLTPAFGSRACALTEDTTKGGAGLG